MYQPNNPVKYQYLKGPDFSVDKLYKDLCITISTELDKCETNDMNVIWAVSFKNPKDKYDKKIARLSVDSQNPKTLFLGKKYSRDEIVMKILADLLYNGSFLSKEYQQFVTYLIYKYSYQLSMSYY